MSKGDLPKELRDSPYIDLRDSLYWREDVPRMLKQEGVRLLYVKVIRIPLVTFGTLPLKYVYNLGVPVSANLLITHPPDANVVALFRKVEEHIEPLNWDENQWGMPFLTIQDIAVMWKWLNGIMKINGDETFWYDYVTVNPHMMTNVTQMATVVCAFAQFAVGYRLLSKRLFGIDWGQFTLEQWHGQKRIAVFTTLQPLIEECINITKRFHVVPYYNPPPYGIFMELQQWANTSKSILFEKMVGTPGNAIYAYSQHENPSETGLLTTYFNLYSNTPKIYFGNHWLISIVAHAYLTQWYNLLGAKDFFSPQAYVLLQQKWGTPKPQQVLDRVDVTIDVAFSERRYCLVQFNPPTQEEYNTMKLFDTAQLHDDKVSLPILSLLPILYYLKSLGVSPIATPNEELIKGLQDQASHENYQLSTVALLTVYAYYVRVLKLASKDWTLTRAKWVWDKSGMTQDQKDKIKDGTGVGPTDSERIKEQLTKYPTPWTLDEKEFTAYLTECYPMPAIRKIKSGEDVDQYLQKKTASENGYLNWFRAIVQRRKTLNPIGGFPIGAPVGLTLLDGKPTQIYNLYMDYGVWELPEERTGWDKFVNFVLNPYKELYGETLLNALLGQAQLILKFILEALDGAGNWVTKFLKENGLYILGGGVIAVLGIREVGNMNKK